MSTTTSDVVVYRGIRFRRYPDSPNWADRSYFTPSAGHKQAGVQRLHQEIWKDQHGQEIPPGHHVHHADHNPLNNDPANLVLLPDGDHRAHHSSDPARVEISRRNIEMARVAAAAWHRSEAGRAWHAEHGARTWDNRAEDERRCDHCGAAYRTRDRTGTARFCSNKCKSAARRASGVDDENRACPTCGTVFTVNRYSTQRACSRACGSALRTDRRRPRVQPDSR